MAQLNSSNVSNGNIIQPNDILQLYDALTAGGGTTGAYNVSISGSITGSATSASYALSASSVTSASFAISSSRAISASIATSSSFATTTTLVSSITMPSGSSPSSNFLAVAAGSITMTGSIGTTAASDPLKSKVLGTSLFINATIFNGQADNVVWVRAYSSGTGAIQFQTASGSGTEFIMWTAYYIPS